MLNFITRKDYSGWETSAQYGIADQHSTFNVSQLFGHSWENGSVLAVYSYSNRSNLMSSSREFISTRQDVRRGLASTSLFNGINVNPPNGALLAIPAASDGTRGPYRGSPIPYPSTGSNFQNFNCPVAAISTNNSGTAYLYPYTTAANTFTVADGVGGTKSQVGLSQSVTNPPQGVCDTQAVTTTLPSSIRNSMIVSMRQALSERIMGSMDLAYGSTYGFSHESRGSVGATVLSSTGTGGPAFGTNQRNPFYVPVPGSTANSEFVRMSFEVSHELRSLHAERYGPTGDAWAGDALDRQKARATFTLQQRQHDAGAADRQGSPCHAGYP